MRHVPPPPLDTAALERLALRYVERFATTRGKLADYLRRKVRERGWTGPAADPAALAERMAALGYLDDRLFAENKAAAMTRRGLGAGRVGQALRAAGIEEADRAAVTEAAADDGWAAALAFARRRRIGPFAAARADPALRQKQIAAMARAGHPFGIARSIVDATPGETIEQDAGIFTHCDDDQPC